MNRNSLAWLTVVAIGLALAFGQYTVRTPVMFDSEGYYRIAEQIRLRGVYIEYPLSELRTYGYPYFLSWVMSVAGWTGVADRMVGFAAQLGLHLAAAGGLWLALRRVGVREWVARSVVAVAMIHPLALIFPGYFLTESLSLPMGTALLAVMVALWPCRGSVWLWLAGGLLCGAMAMVRPVNLYLLAIWTVVAGAAVWRRREWAAVLGLLVVMLPWWPQWRNNQVYHGVSSPLVATSLTKDLQGLGVLLLKYATSSIPDEDPRITYKNPFLKDANEGWLDPAGWYRKYPIAGAATLAWHGFALLDQDLPFPYAGDLDPWYSRPVSAATWALTAMGILTMGVVWRRRRELTAGERGIAGLTVAVVVAHLGAHLLYAPEARFGVAALMPLHGWAVVGLLELRRRGSGDRMGASIVMLTAAGLGLWGSSWLREQSPAIQDAIALRREGPAEAILRLTRRRPSDELCRAPWATWSLNRVGVNGSGEAVLISDGQSISALEYDVRLEKNREYTVSFEAWGEAGWTGELSVDLYAGGGYDHPEQNGLVLRHSGRFEAIAYTWNSGSDAPEYARLRFVTLSRKPFRVRNVKFEPIQPELAEWTLHSAWVGLGGEGVLCTAGDGVSVISRKVPLERNTEYTVEFDVRGPETDAEELIVELDGGPGYDREARRRIVRTFQPLTFTRQRFQWHSGTDAPAEGELRFTTANQRPVQVRRIRFEKKSKP